MAIIDVERVSVDFPIYHGSSRSLKRTVLSAASDALASRREGAATGQTRDRLAIDSRRRTVVQALRDVSFTLRDGDRLGLVGGNGAGKTTLLRTVAGIYEPVAGRVRVQGSLGTLIDPNLGMNGDLTGRENITLRGQYDGLSRPAIRRLEEDVQAFAELGDFMDLPVRFYSSGMVLRLGFALATGIRHQILVMDEWFLAGDAAFMERARARLEDLVRGADILVMSSHLPGVVQEWCTRALWMDAGRVRDEGSPDAVLNAYLGTAHPAPVAAPAVG